MALDEALFHWSAGTGLAAARFYHWETPALTVGCVFGEASMACTPMDGFLRLAGTLEFSGVNLEMRRNRLEMLNTGARKYLRERLNVEITGYLAQLGPIALEAVSLSAIDENPFFCADPARVRELEQFMDELREAGDSIGAKLSILAQNVPPGLGEPVFDKLEADLAKGLMSINAVKGVEIGAGFAAVSQRGSEHRDQMTPDGFDKNDAGGTLGGISSGQDILASIALKPTSSIAIPGKTVDKAGQRSEIVTTGRHDPCVGLRAVPIAEAMVALVLMDHYLRHRGQNADVASGTPVIPGK